MSYTNITKCVCNAEFHHLACQTQVSLTGDHRSPCQKVGADFSKRHLKYIISVILLSETENANEVPPVYPDIANVFREKCKFEQRVILLSEITGEQKYKRDLQVRFQSIHHRNKNHTSLSLSLPQISPSNMEHYPPWASYECGEVTTPECRDFVVCTPSLGGLGVGVGEKEERGNSKEEDKKGEMQSSSDAKLLC